MKKIIVLSGLYLFSKNFLAKEQIIPNKKNIFQDYSPSKDEIFEDLLKNSNFKVERIISKGQRSPDGFWYEQEQDEWVLLLEGNAILLFEDNTKVDMKKGDYILIPKYCKHRVEWTDPTKETFWLAIHYSQKK